MPTFTFSTRESYAAADPFILNPPMVTDDGDDPLIDHGHRLIPLVGGLRHPYIDVSFADFNDDDNTRPVRVPAPNFRVYADDYEDAFAAFAGPDCQDAVMTLRALEAGEDVRPEDAADADLLLQFTRSRFAIPAATIAQRKINERAKKPVGEGDYDPLAGTWDTLSDEEKDILTANAQSPYNDQGRLSAPVAQGIVVDWDLAAPGDEPKVVKRGSWSARVPLVVCEQNYWPIGNAIPLWETMLAEFNGRTLQTETNGAVVKTIHVTDSQQFIEDLTDLDVISTTVRSPKPFNDSMMDIAHEFFGNEEVQKYRLGEKE